MLIHTKDKTENSSIEESELKLSHSKFGKFLLNCYLQVQGQQNHLPGKPYKIVKHILELIEAPI